MKKKKTIAAHNLPPRLPLYGSLVAWLVLDRLVAPGWVWGVVGTLFGLIWIVMIVEVIRWEPVDIFDER